MTPLITNDTPVPSRPCDGALSSEPDRRSSAGKLTYLVFLTYTDTEDVNLDPFLVSTTAEDQTARLNEVANNLRVTNGPQSMEDPSSLSPKHREPLRPLTASQPQEQDSSGSDKPDVMSAPASASPMPAVADGLSPPLPLLLPKSTIGSREEAILHNRLVSVRLDHGDWMDTSHQIGGGYLHPFHLPGQYFPYQGGYHGLMPPHGMLDPRRGMPYRDSHNVYHEEAYRGHPHGTYGGFFPGLILPGVHQDMRGSSPFFPNYVDRPYHDHQLQGPTPHTNWSPTCEPHQVHPPYAQRAPAESSAPSTSADGAK